MDKYRILVKGLVKFEDKYLIVKKWYDDRIAEPYQWEFIDGVIDSMEAPDKAVIRTIFENTGISALIDRILYTWTFKTGDVFNIGISYLCMAPNDDVFLSEELHEYKWIKRDDFQEFLPQKVLVDLDRVEL